MYDIHEFAGIVPLACEKEQRALTLDINTNGQRDPAVLWNEQIVDGRCRQIACDALGIDLQVKRLPDTMSEAEVRRTVKSLNTRRNLTMTQKVVSAHYDYVKGYGTLDEIATSWAISRRALANCNYIAKYKEKYLEPLFNGDSIVLFDTKKNKEITTNRISTITKLVKEEADREVKVVTPEDYDKTEYNVSGQLKYEQHKDYFYAKVAAFNSTGADKEYLFQITLKELLNTKQELEDMKSIYNKEYKE